MSSTKFPVNIHQAYHAHIYFEADTLEQAETLIEKIAETFKSLPIGRVHQRPVGPHPMWSCQVIFKNRDFDAFVPWLDEHRNGLTVLVHGLSGNNLKDHTDYAYWLGESKTLNLTMFE